MVTQKELIEMAFHVLNGRARGREQRIAELRAAGIPVDDRAALAAWHSRAARDQAASDGYWFRGWSARVENGVAPDLPTYGRFGCRIDEAMPVAVDYTQGEGADPDRDPEDRYGWRFVGSLGISGGNYATESEALAAAEAHLAAEGFTRNPGPAEQAAMAAAHARHTEKLTRPSYARKYGEQPKVSPIGQRWHTGRHGEIDDSREVSGACTCGGKTWYHEGGEGTDDPACWQCEDCGAAYDPATGDKIGE